MFIHSKRLPIELTNGTVKEIRALSASDTEEFKETFNLLAKELDNEKYKTLNITQAFVKEPLVKHYITSIFNLINLSPEDVSANTMFALLFPHETPDGGYERQGHLTKFIFGEVKGGSKSSKEDVDAYAQALGRLWAVMNNYKDACTILNDLGYEDLEAVLLHRADALKPAEEKVKEQAMKRAMEAKERLTDEFKLNGKIEIGEEIKIEDLM